jgi:hypothetical protein
MAGSQDISIGRKVCKAWGQWGRPGDVGILDVVIGVVFAYVLLAVLVTAINEWIAGIFPVRAKTLRRALTAPRGGVGVHSGSTEKCSYMS